MGFTVPRGSSTKASSCNLSSSDTIVRNATVYAAFFANAGTRKVIQVQHSIIVTNGQIPERI